MPEFDLAISGGTLTTTSNTFRANIGVPRLPFGGHRHTPSAKTRLGECPIRNA
jgi:hypothetical protein